MRRNGEPLLQTLECNNFLAPAETAACYLNDECCRVKQLLWNPLGI